MINRPRYTKVSTIHYLLAFITKGVTLGTLLIYIQNSYTIEYIISVIIVSLILLYSMFFYIYTQKKEFLTNFNKLFLLFFLYNGVLIISFFMLKFNYYLLPIFILGMLITVLLDTNLAIVVNWILIVLISLTNLSYAIEIFLFYSIAGINTYLLIRYIKKRINIVWVSLVILTINTIIALLIQVILHGVTFINYNIMLYVVLNSAFSIIFTVGSLPLWETLFNILTRNKLLELGDIDQTIIKRLLNEAPGTFHHSQVVANLAETAVTAIGGDYLLARIGSLYHDIGKLQNPKWFKENQDNENPHDLADPLMSAQIILGHVDYGIKLANEYHLPKQIKDIIRQHQGTTTIKYFYNKAKDLSISEEIKESDFIYKGPKPQTNEAAIIMLADSLEASVRSIPQNNKNIPAIELAIQRIIKIKWEDHQLDECSLKISDLKIISDAFLKVYKGMYHDRIIN